jgi:hypothetical protein
LKGDIYTGIELKKKKEKRKKKRPWEISCIDGDGPK